MGKKKNKKIIKTEYLNKNYIYNIKWKKLYEIYDNICNIIIGYFGKIIVAYEDFDIQMIKITFEINKKIYDCMISNRGNDFGFCVSRVDISEEYNNLCNNKTIKNDKFYLYNMYKIIFMICKSG